MMQRQAQQPAVIRRLLQSLRHSRGAGQMIGHAQRHRFRRRRAARGEQFGKHMLRRKSGTRRRLGSSLFPAQNSTANVRRIQAVCHIHNSVAGQQLQLRLQCGKRLARRQRLQCSTEPDQRMNGIHAGRRGFAQQRHARARSHALGVECGGIGLDRRGQLGITQLLSGMTDCRLLRVLLAAIVQPGRHGENTSGIRPMPAPQRSNRRPSSI